MDEVAKLAVAVDVAGVGVGVGVAVTVACFSMASCLNQDSGVSHCTCEGLVLLT